MRILLVFFLLFFAPPSFSKSKNSLSIKRSQKKQSKLKKKTFPRKWSISSVNGYTFYNGYNQKSGSAEPYEWAYVEGKMHPYFSALEIARIQGWYDFGIRIQNTGFLFVSPFFTWNLRKNHTRIRVLPSLTLGVVPSHILGAWLRFSLGFGISRHVSLAPFLSFMYWTKVGEDPDYEKRDSHAHLGLQLLLYY